MTNDHSCSTELLQQRLQYIGLSGFTAQRIAAIPVRAVLRKQWVVSCLFETRHHVAQRSICSAAGRGQALLRKLRQFSVVIANQ